MNREPDVVVEVSAEVSEMAFAEERDEPVVVSPAVEGQDEAPEEAEEGDETSFDEGAIAARELAEHNALADVFDDVRRQSAASVLVQPTRWEAIGLVPEHLDPEEFEMFVYEYLEDARETNAEAEAAAEVPVYRTATRAVGVPQFGKKKSVETEGGDGSVSLDGSSDEEVRDSDSFRNTVGDDEERDGDENGSSFPSEQSEQASVVENDTSSVISSDAAEGGADAVDTDNPFANLKIPEGFKLVELEGEYVLVPDENAVPVERTIDCTKVVTLVGAHSYYLYDRSVMTDTYAHWAFLAAEDNQVVTFVDCVREDSRVYPRPLAASSLRNEPFNMSADEVTCIWDIVRESGEYPDIGQTTASNGDVYYFSTNHLSEVYAVSLAEWDAVERDMNR